MITGGNFKEFAEKNAVAIFAVAIVMTIIVVIIVGLILMKKAGWLVKPEYIGCKTIPTTGITLPTDTKTTWACP
jgi:hypothetical protein